MPHARVSVFTRWNNAVVESRKTSIDYLALDQFRQEIFSQEEFYESSVRPFVSRCLQGCPGSIVTCGAWGSGKSYTLGALDLQQLAPKSPCSSTGGVLSRCTQQLFEWLGEGASVEVTCVEVQGDEIVDLLDQRAGPVTLGRGAATDGFADSSGRGGSPGAAHHVPLPHATLSRSPIAVAAAGSTSSARRKPLTLVVARSVGEALSTLQRAVASRQAFVTSTRHSSSRTHAVFQLRWRNPATAAAGESAAKAAGSASRDGGSSGGGLTQRAFSAPPRASLAMSSAGGSTVGTTGRGSRPPSGGGCGPVCTLTLVDTCSFCPLLPPKEGSAVKRSLLALNRVLSGLQRRGALSLRESKLTRMLEGAVDQVLVLACLGGAGDEPTVQLVKALQQGTPRDSALRRSRRASSSDSTRVSDAWESSGHGSICAVSTFSIASITGGQQPPSAARLPPTPPQHKGTPGSAGGPPRSVLGGRPAGGLLGHSPARSVFRSPGASPVPDAACAGSVGRGPVVTRTAFPEDAEDTTRVHLRLAGDDDGDEEDEDDAGPDPASGGCSSSTSGGGAAADMDAAAAARPPLSTSSLDLFAAASPRGSASRGTADGRAAAAEEEAQLADACRPAPLAVRANTDDARADDGDDAGRGHFSPGGSGSGGWRSGRANPSPRGVRDEGVRTSRGWSPRLVSPRQKPPSVTARAAPPPEVRRSQGFSVLAGKWAPPPAVSPRDTSFPTLPCLLAAPAGRAGAAGASTAASQRSSGARSATGASTESSMSAGASGRLPRGTPATGPSPRTASGPRPSPGRGPAAFSGADGAAGESKRISGDSTSGGLSPSAGGGAGGGIDTFPSPFAAASRDPLLAPDVVVAHTATTDRPPQTSSPASTTQAAKAASGAGAVSRGHGDASPASSSGTTPGRRKSGIPARPGFGRSPQPAPRSGATPAARSPSPSPVKAGALVSLGSVRPTRLASQRYGSANISHDSAHEGTAFPVPSAAAAAEPPLPADAPLHSVFRTSQLLKRFDIMDEEETVVAAGAACRERADTTPAAAATAGVEASKPGDGVGPLAVLRRSLRGGMRWPSPLLRARRTERLSDLRRSRSAHHRPLAEMPLEGVGATPRQASHGGRRAPAGRPTLSALYQDLLQDFEAFKAKERQPRHRRSILGAADPPPIESIASAPPGSTVPVPSPDRRFVVTDRTVSPAPSDALTHGSTLPPTSPLREHPSAGVTSTPGTTCTATSPAHPGAVPGALSATIAGSPAASAGLPAGSPASISTAHSARPLSGTYSRPPAAAFSRAHSPSGDEGLMSLTAAAAVAAASPRTPASGGALTGGRPRPGVSRAAGTTASPRPLRSPERPSTPVSPVTVLDMNRLYTAAAQPALTQPQPPGSGRSRLSAGSGTAAAAAAGGALASGGSDRYKRLAEEVADSDEDGSDSEAARDRGMSEAGSDPCVGSDSDRDNLLGPASLVPLGLMLDTGGDVAALRSSISRLADSGRASPAAAAVLTATATTSSPLGRAAASAAAASAAASAGSGAPSDSRASTSTGPRRRLDTEGAEAAADSADEELPAVSFFILQFAPSAEVKGKEATAGDKEPDGDAATAGMAAGGIAPSCPAEPSAAAGPATQEGNAAAGRAEAAAAGRGANTPAEAAQCCDGANDQTVSMEVEAAPPPTGTEPGQQTPRRSRRNGSGLVPVAVSPRAIAAAAAAASVAAAATGSSTSDLHPSHLSQDRCSVESGVLRGSCTPFAVGTDPGSGGGSGGGADGPSAPLSNTEDPAQGSRPQACSGSSRPQSNTAATPPDPSATPAAPSLEEGPVHATPPAAGKQQPENAGISPPSQSSISLRQLLEQQQLLLQQQRPGRWAAAAMALGGGHDQPGPPWPAAADAADATSLAQPPSLAGDGHLSASSTVACTILGRHAHVRANHVDLDEQSYVRVDDSLSELEPASAAVVVADAPKRRPIVSTSSSSSSSSLRTMRAAAAIAAGAGAATACDGSRLDGALTSSPARPGAPAAQLRPAVHPSSPPLKVPSPMPSMSPVKLQSQRTTPARQSQSSVRDRVAALEAALWSGTPSSATPAGATAGASPRVTPRLMQSWAHDGPSTRRSSGSALPTGCAAKAAAVAAAAVSSPQSASADTARRAAAHLRLSPVSGSGAGSTAKAAAPAAASSLGTVASKHILLSGGSGGTGTATSADAFKNRVAAGGGGATHSRQLSDGVVNGCVGAGAGAEPAPRRSSLGRVPGGSAAGLPVAPPPVRVARSIDDATDGQRPGGLLSPTSTLPPAGAHQQSLRGSGNVAAAWRAAAAKSKSSNSSVRSCFRSNPGQQPQPLPQTQVQVQVQPHNLLGTAGPHAQQQQQQAMIGSDATAVATVVALNRASPAVGDDKGTLSTLSTASRTSGHTATAALANAAKLSSGSDQLHSAISAARSYAAAVMGQPPLLPPPQPPQPHPTVAASQSPLTCRAAAAGLNLPYVPPLILPSAEEVVDDAAAASRPPPPPPLQLQKAKSARGERTFALTARLRGCKSHRTPRASPPAVGGSAAVLEAPAEQPPPPPAYPPGFISWAAKLFGSRKHKQKG